MIKKVKIDGVNFKKIKIIKDKMLKYQDEFDAKIKEAQKVNSKNHAELWKEIYSITKLDKDGQHKLDDTHEDLGFYVIEEKDASEEMPEFIKKLIGGIDKRIKEISEEEGVDAPKMQCGVVNLSDILKEKKTKH